MKTSIIWLRVSDFLRQYPPFEYFGEADLLELAQSGRVTFHQAGEFLFQQGSRRRECVWVIQQGTVDIIDDERGVVDILGAGDIAGLACALDSETYAHSARTTSDVMVYALDAARIVRLLGEYPEAWRFATAYLSLHGRSTGQLAWFEEPHPPLQLLRRRSEFAGKGPPFAPPGLNTGDYLLRMIRSNAEHVTLTVGGDPASMPQGTLSAADLAISGGRDVLSLIRGVARAAGTDELGYLCGRARALVASSIGKPQDVSWCSSFATELLFACVRRLIALTGPPGAPAAASYCVAAAGGAGRGETLVWEFPEIAILCEDNVADPWFHELVRNLDEGLCACGYRKAGRSVALRSLTGWKELFSGMVHDPVLRGTFVRRGSFDLAFVCGSELLLAELRQHIRHAIDTDDAFLAVLTNDTFSSLPPLTLYGDTVVELDGARIHGLDLRSSVINPLVDVGRVFALKERELATTGTAERLMLGAQSHPSQTDLLRAAREALLTAMYYEFRHGQTRVSPNLLSGYDRSMLKTAFRGVQRLLEFSGLS